MRIVFAGTPEFALPSLKALCNSDTQVVAVYSQPDRRAGRGRKLKASPVKTCAIDNGIDVYQPVRFDQAAIEQFRQLNADLAVVVAYGLLLPEAILQAPRLGCINVHASLLPRWRGAAPVARAIESGDAKSGITLMQMDAGLDTGAILHQSEIDLDPREDAISLHDRLAQLGGDCLADNLDGIINQTLPAEPQRDEHSTYASKLSKAEADIDWSHNCDQIDRKVRALTGWPVATSTFNGEVWKIWQARPQRLASPAAGQIVRVDADGIVVGCADDCLQITQLQRPGGKRLNCDAFLRGLQQGLAVGDRLGPAAAAKDDGPRASSI